MKDLRLSNLKKRKKQFFKNLGTIRTDNKSYKTLELIARKSYEAIPSRLKRYIDNPEEKIKFAARLAHYNMEGFDFYKALVKTAEGNPRYSWHTNRETIWNAFKSQKPELYMRYISYMARRGIAGTTYWYDHVEFSHAGSVVYTMLSLDTNSSYDVNKAKVIYQELFIDYDHSGGIIVDAGMNL